MQRQFEWRRNGAQDYLYAQGETRFDLGYAIGMGALKQITAARVLYNQIIASFGEENKMVIREAIAASTRLIPPEDMEEIKGLLDGYHAAGGEELSLEGMAMQSFAIDLSHQMEGMKSGDPLVGCTNFASINPNGEVVHGQNYDSDPRLSAADMFVHCRTSGVPDVFLYRPGGSLGMAVGKNECGVTMTVSVIKSHLRADMMTPRAVLVRRAMEHQTAASAISAMTDEQGRSPFCYNLIVSDGATAIGVQSIPWEQRLNHVKRTLVQSNQYDYIDWQKHLRYPAASRKRQLYAEALLDNLYARYGGVDEDTLLEILRDEPVICRKVPGDGIGTTVLYLTRQHFGLGNPQDGPPGVIPF